MVLAKGEDLEDRLTDFAVQIIKLCAYLPRTQSGQHLAGQLLRSGTAPAAYYAAACSTEDDADFLDRLKNCLKELNEARIWLTIITKSDLLTSLQLQNITTENDELCRIISSRIKTAQQEGKTVC